MSDKHKIFSALFRSVFSPGKIDFRTLLTDLATQALGKSRIDAEAFADANQKKYWNWLLATLDEHARRGLIPYFFVPSSSSYSIECAGHQMESSSDDGSQLLGRFVRARPYILSQIDELTDREYEALACVACAAIGARDFYLTPPGNEGGIDFFATISAGSKSHIFSSQGREIRVVGQCKKYTSPLAVDRVEQFLQTMQNIRHRADRVRAHIPSWFNDSTGPIVGWIICHDGFQSGTASEAKQHGLVVADSVDLAELLSQSEAIAPLGSFEDRAKEIRQKCLALLS